MKKTKTRERQLEILKDRLEEWYWTAIQTSPQGDDGEVCSFKVDLMQAGHCVPKGETEEEELFAASVITKRVETGL
jgi:hypothetical protein